MTYPCLIPTTAARTAAARPPALPRREFLALSGLTVLAAALVPWPVMAGPFEASDFARLVPPDKKLNPPWVQSLTARGDAARSTPRRAAS